MSTHLPRSFFQPFVIESVRDVGEAALEIDSEKYRSENDQ